MQPSISMLPEARRISNVSPGPRQPSKISVLACTKLGGTTAIAAYRALWPLEALASREGFGVCRAITQENLAKLEQAGRSDDMRGYDIYVLQRILGRKEDHIGHFFDTLHGDGSKIVFDTDDRLDDECRELGYADALRDTLEYVDAITVSTPQLAKSMEKYGKPIYVAYNRLKTEWFHTVTQQAERVFDNLVVGLIGTRSHWGDWQLVTDALTRLRQTHPDVVVAICGYYPPYYERLPGLKKFAPVCFEFFPALLRQADIILSPLDTDDLFNHSKSAVAALESMAATRPVNGGIGGAVPIVSDMKFYRRVVNHRNNGMIVRDNSDWYDTIVEVIENHALRQKMQRTGWKWVQKFRDIGQADDWARAYKQIVQ